ncbi:hypothetical protein HDU98_003306 [Podochytrium sp. JEL0797]|nr:hypothetical protein HDU98_003306 [Podochytrium sp. JEL0797]
MTPPPHKHHCPIDTLPQELIQQILLHLPLTSPSHLLTVALSSRHHFAPSLLSPSFPRRHFLHHFHSSTCTDIWTFLDSIHLISESWSLLPVSYQTAIFGIILAAPEWPGVHTSPLADDMSDNLMWYKRWPLKHPYETVSEIAQCTPGFKIAAQKFRLFRWTCRSGYLSAASMLLRDVELGVDPSADEEYAVRCSSESGHLGVVRMLLEDGRVDPTGKKNYAVRAAATFGHVEIVDMLLLDARVDPSDCNNAAVILASRNGHAAVVERLVRDPRVDPGANANEAVQDAATGGHAGVLKVLVGLERVDPRVREDAVLRLACRGGHVDAILVLLACPRIDCTGFVAHILVAAVKENRCDLVDAVLEKQELDPSARNNIAFKTAIVEKRGEIARRLLLDERVKVALEVKQEYALLVSMLERLVNREQ